MPAGHRQGVKAIGIGYQMHGLVLVDGAGKPVRPAIIWCDGRAAASGEQMLEALGRDYCFGHLLNAPGNFTAAKLKWVADNEPSSLEKARAAMLPGDYIALRLSGDAATTRSGLSEMTLWDFEENRLAEPVLKQSGAPSSILPRRVPTFGVQAELLASVGAELGLAAGIPITYRAGDQPNNALSLSCLDDGDVAATAGTSGVVYGVAAKAVLDPGQRFNTFLHVNDRDDAHRFGLLLCINGCGSLNSWLRNRVFDGRYSYDEMNHLAAQAPVGCDGLKFYPFGNGAERILGNRSIGASLERLEFFRHDARHLCRAAQEGIAFALRYGMEAGISAKHVRAGHANLFLSPVFTQTFSNLTGAEVEIWNTDGATGAARGAAIGLGVFPEPKYAFKGVEVVVTYEPVSDSQLEGAYENWKSALP